MKRGTGEERAERTTEDMLTEVFARQAAEAVREWETWKAEARRRYPDLEGQALLNAAWRLSLMAGRSGRVDVARSIMRRAGVSDE